MTTEFHATTICAVQRDGKTAIAGDGQVTMGNSVIMKGTAQKVRRLYHGKIVSGFAGSVADAFTLFDRFEDKLNEHNGNLVRSAVELAKDWRADKILHKLEAHLSGRGQQMLDDIRQHKMDDREIEVEVAEQERTIQGILTGNSTEELTNNFQEMLGSILPKKKKMKKMTIAKAREVFKEEELEKCLDMVVIVDKAIEATEEAGIGFID